MAVVGLALAVAAVGGGVAYAYFTGTGSGTGTAQVGTNANILIDQLGGTPMYNSTIDPTAYQASQCYYCVQMGDLGNKINLSGGGGPLSDVVVAMANFGGTATTMNITMSVYNPGTYSGPGSPPGTLIATDKQLFNIPAGPNGGNGSAYCQTGAGDTDPYCGIGNFNITFNFAPQDVTLPGTVVYDLQYNDAQTVANGGVNVQLVNESSQISVGSDTAPGYAFTDLASLPSNGYNATYNDVGPGQITNDSVGTVGAPNPFGEYPTADVGSNGLAPYIPAVEFDTNTAGDLYPGGPSQFISFSMTNTGNIPVTVSDVTIAVATDGSGDVQTGNPASDVTGCNADWFTVSPVPVVVGATIPAGGTVDWVDQATITMPSNINDQDACQGVPINLTFTSS